MEGGDAPPERASSRGAPCGSGALVLRARGAGVAAQRPPRITGAGMARKPRLIASAAAVAELRKAADALRKAKREARLAATRCPEAKPESAAPAAGKPPRR